MNGVIKDIKYDSNAFAECLQSFTGMCVEEAEKYVARYQEQYKGALQIHTEVKPRFSFDNAKGTSRPVAIAQIIADETASKEEAENKSLSKQVY